MKHIKWSPSARIAAREIARHIAEDNPSAAGKWLRTLYHKVEPLRQFPESGRLVPESEDFTLREIFYGAYRIIYEYDGKLVEILTIRHGKRTLPPEEIPGN